MSKARFGEDFERDAVRQITDRGYPVAGMSQRLGGSTFSLSHAEDVLVHRRKGDEPPICSWRGGAVVEVFGKIEYAGVRVVACLVYALLNTLPSQTRMSV
jgi:hypothetical protein